MVYCMSGSVSCRGTEEHCARTSEPRPAGATASTTTTYYSSYGHHNSWLHEDEDGTQARTDGPVFAAATVRNPVSLFQARLQQAISALRIYHDSLCGCTARV